MTLIVDLLVTKIKQQFEYIPSEKYIEDTKSKIY